MLASKEKISIRQLMIVLFTITYTLVMRALPVHATKTAHQAAWLSPVVTVAVFIPLILVFNSIYKKYKEESFMEVMEDILGKLPGKIMTALYIVLVTFLLCINTSNYADKLVYSIFPNVNIMVFFVIMLAFVAFTLRGGGLVVVARMNEIIFVILVSIFISLFLLSINNIKIGRLTPISTLDFFPIMQANIASMVYFSHFSFLFLLSNYVNNKENLKKVCLTAAGILSLLFMLVLILIIGVLGAPIVELAQNPYITTIKQISLFQTLERFESFVVSQWIFSDFVLLSILLFTVLNLFKSLFKLSDIKPFIYIYSVITLLVSLMLAGNSTDLDTFITSVIFPSSIFFGYVMPVLVFLVGKIRKKL